MKSQIKTARGSENIFRDLGVGDADLEQLRSILAAKILGVLDNRKLLMRGARAITGIAAAEFSRIRRANRYRFTIDLLMTILTRLAQHVDVSVKVTARRTKYCPTGEQSSQ